MIKIVYFYLGQLGGGSAYDALELAKGLSNQAELLCVVSSKSKSYKDWISESKTNPNFRVLGVSTTKNILKGIFMLFNYPKFKKIRNNIRSFKPDVSFSYMVNPLERLIVPYVNAKIVISSIHDVRLHEGENSLFDELRIKLFSFKPDYYCVYSNNSKVQLIKQGIDERKIIVVPLGCLKRYFGSDSVNPTLLNKVLFFGRFVRYKGIEILLKSIEMISDSHPEIKVVLAGRGDISEYQEIINRHSDTIEVHNKWIMDDEIKNYFEDSDIVVAPYYSATQSGVVLMSYSFGKPVVVSDVGGLTEQVVEDETGLIVPVGNPEALAKAITSLYDTPEKIYMMKKKAFDYSNNHSWDDSSKQLFSKIETILK